MQDAMIGCMMARFVSKEVEPLMSSDANMGAHTPHHTQIYNDDSYNALRIFLTHRAPRSTIYNVPHSRSLYIHTHNIDVVWTLFDIVQKLQITDCSAPLLNKSSSQICSIFFLFIRYPEIEFQMGKTF